MGMVNCRHFNGYKPCKLNAECNNRCPHLSFVTKQILIIHLEAMGSVLRSTSILPAIHRQYPGCHVTWVTKKPSDQLLANNPHIHRVITTSHEDLLKLHALQFDAAYVLDKSLVASGILRSTRVRQIFGFIADTNTGAIVPANVEAHEMWELGLSDAKKFKLNKKSEGQLWIEALNLGIYRRDPYVYQMTEAEIQESGVRRQKWAPQSQIVVGINTGCSPWIPYRQLTVEGHRKLIAELLSITNVKVVLLGGPDETAKNQQIAKDLDVAQSPTQAGPRDGAMSMNACDVVISGDSLGLHMGIALQKWVVGWFGPTVAQEVDLYDRGVKVQSAAACSPCYKSACQKPVMCYDLVSIAEIVDGVKKGIEWKSSSSKLLSSGISSSASL